MRLRRAAARGAVLVAALWAAGSQSAAAGEAKTGKTSVSANGVYGIRMTERGDGQCVLEAVRDQERVWALSRCLGNADDLYFIANDGERFWVLSAVPPLPPRHKSRRPPLVDAPVARLYKKDGAVMRTVVLGELVPAGRLHKMRMLSHHFKWLRGVAGEAGTPPRSNDKEVELETLDFTRHALPF